MSESREYTLRRTGGAPIRFRGVRVTQAGGNEPPRPDANRWYSGATYRTDDGRWVARLEFHSQWQGESGASLVAVGRTADEVREWLEVEDPRPSRVGFPTGPQYSERQALLLAQLNDERGRIVSELLDHEAFAATLDDAQAASRDRRDLARYRRLLAEAHRRLGFSEAEASLVCDALNGWGSFSLADPEGYDSDLSWWPASVEDAIRDQRLDEKWGVDGGSVLARIGRLSLVQLAAVADAAERFWASPRLNQIGSRELLEEAGFVLAD